VAAAAGPGGASNETLQTLVQLQHPLSKKKVTALLDTGSNVSLIARAHVSWVKSDPNQKKTYRTVDKTLASTQGTIELKVSLSEFTSSQSCVHVFEVSEDLLYPIVLGMDFIRAQQFVFDFQEKVIKWEGKQVAMKSYQYKPLRTVFAVESEDDSRLMRILDVHGKEVPLQALVPKETLTEEQAAQMLRLLEEFRVIMTKKIEKLRMAAYVLPVKEAIPPHSAPPFAIPKCYQEATFKEVERLVQLEVLEEARIPHGHRRPL
jgi:hypothetical protein